MKQIRTHFALQAMALTVLLQGIPIPQPTGFVNDFAGVLSAESSAELTRIITDIRSRTRGEIAVVTIADIRDESVVDLTGRIGNAWKVGASAPIGDPARNTGVLLLIVPRETNSSGRGHCRIEPARGAEGFITDGMAGELCRAAVPLFQQRNYSAAALQIVRGLARAYEGEFPGADTAAGAGPGAGAAGARDRRSIDSGEGEGMGPGLVGLIGPLVFAFIVFMMLRGGTRRYVRGRRPGTHGGLPVDPLLFAVLSDVLFSGRGRRRSGGWSDPGAWGGGFGGGGGGAFGGGGGGGFSGFGGGGDFAGGGGGADW